MENEIIQIGDFSVVYYSINTLIIGSGAASLNAAASLSSMGQKDLIIATSGWGSGTSNNAGSDKQTYYKLSLCGDQPDSVRIMAQDLFNGHCMHGDIALCEAQGSVQAFMKLVSLGVPFPHDKYGSWAGYKTDHDPRARATSAGPKTSGMMFSVLSDEVRRQKIKVLDHHQVVALLTDRNKEKVTSALAINTSEKDPFKAFVLFNSVNIILGTGGPGDIYYSSVYPLSQTGSAGMALRAGATGQNLTESQFGISSIKFRWNLSGSYQQVIPRYISTDSEGNDQKEFLNEFFPDYKSLSLAIFRKGYQWPFDPAKISGYGSSLIDLLVYSEIEEKGRRVFLDFTRDITWNSRNMFSASELDAEVRDYLIASDAVKNNPFERLCSMNPKAADLFRENGIDLEYEPVEIGICAQHNNGGLRGNIWWESDLKHLFPVGEVNGSHGVYRPGGSALNSGQVGSQRAAVFISKKYKNNPPGKKDFLDEVLNEAVSTLSLAKHFLSHNAKSKNNEVLIEIRKRMSANGSIIRSRVKVLNAVKEAWALQDKIRNNLAATTVTELADCFRIFDNCLTHVLYLEAIKKYIEEGGRSRGAYLVTNKEKYDLSGFCAPDPELELCQYDRNIEKDILEIRFDGSGITHNLIKVREIPEQNLWFEKVWRDYLEDNFYEG